MHTTAAVDESLSLARDDPDGGPAAAAARVRFLTRVYRVAFVASLLLSAAVALLSWERPRQMPPGLLGRFMAWFGALLPTPPDEAAGTVGSAAAAAAGDGARFQQIMDRLHPVPSLPFALVQVAAVVAISTMWFFAFTLRATRRHPAGTTMPMRRYSAPVLASLLPVVIFVLAMYQAYQPAVLVMALVAILVAAEHYSGLTLQERELDEQRRQLKKQEMLLQKAQDALTTQSDDLEKQTQTLKAASADLNELNKSTARLLSDAGLSQFLDTVYAAYEHAARIRAVVRLHEIDVEWWQWARDAVDAPDGAAADPWEPYFRSARRPGTGGGITLARALQVTPARPRVCAAFVTDLPMPGSAEWRRRAADPEEPLFQDLLGLAWQLVVLNHLRATSAEGVCNVSGWISRPLCWVHATDTQVFQVLRREPREQSAVLIIADTSRGAALCSAAESESSAGILAWAHDEIQRYVERGVRAQEYVFAALRYALTTASKYDTTQLAVLERQGAALVPRATDDLRYLLTLLGSEFWLRSKARHGRGAGKIRDDASAVAIAGDVFARLIHDVAPPVEDDHVHTAAELTLELQ